MKRFLFPVFFALVLSFSLIPLAGEETVQATGNFPKKGSLALAISAPLADSGAIYLQSHITDVFALRPGLYIAIQNDVDSSDPGGDRIVTSNYVRFSLAGLYYVGNNDFIRGYFGAEIAVARQFNRTENKELRTSSADEYLQFFLIPFGGAQVQIHRHIALFGEAGLSFSTGGAGNAMNEDSRTLLSTFTQRIGVLFYFN